MNAKSKLLTAMLLVPLAALAAEAPPADFKTIDRNGDGYLSRDEVQAVVPQILAVFDRVDGDKDGKLNPAEYDAALRILATARS